MGSSAEAIDRADALEVLGPDEVLEDDDEKVITKEPLVANRADTVPHTGYMPDPSTLSFASQFVQSEFEQRVLEKTAKYGARDQRTRPYPKPGTVVHVPDVAVTVPLPEVVLRGPSVTQYCRLGANSVTLPT